MHRYRALYSTTEFTQIRYRTSVHLPVTIVTVTNMEFSLSISQLKRKRNGKKWAVTKYIQEIDKLIAEKGSRTKLKYLKEFLNETQKSAHTLHENFMLRLEEDHPDFNDNWIEELSVRANSCNAAIESYMAERVNDPSSTMSSGKARQISQWREESAKYSTLSDPSEEPLFAEKHISDEVIPGEVKQTLNSEDCDAITDAFSRIYVDQNRTGSINTNEERDFNGFMQSNNLPLIESHTADQGEEQAPTKTNNIELKKVYSLGKTQYRFNPEHHTSTTKRRHEKKSFCDAKDLKHSLNRRFSEIETGSIHQPDIEEFHRTYLVDMSEQRPVQVYNSTSNPTRNDVVKRVTLPKEESTERIPTVIQTKVVSIDDWIDHLNPYSQNISATPASQADIPMQMLIQQRLPRQTLVVFEGDPGRWIEFISKFFDLVHKQPFLDAFQKRTYLIQHLKGEALKSVEGFANDDEGYVRSLKRLKYMFGNRALVADATIRKITSGRQVPDYDSKALSDFYYSVSSCINTLRKMNYQSDIYSSHVLRQTLARLPSKLHQKWSEYSLRIRKREEPNLIHLDNWLQERVMASKDPYLPQNKIKRVSNLHTHGWKSNQVCPCCKQDHLLFKCEKYKEKPDSQKLNFVKSNRLCFNCLSSHHSARGCSSKKFCFKTGCKKRHHTSLHQALTDSSASTLSTSTTPSATTPTSTIPTVTLQTTPTQESDTPHLGIMKNNRSVFLQIVPLKIRNREGSTVETFALLDSGSQCTVMTKSLCQKLNLQGRMRKVKFGTIKDDEIIPAKIVNFEVSSTDDQFKLHLNNVYSIEDNLFNVPGQTVPVNSEARWDYLRNVPLQDVDPEQIQILIGADAVSYTHLTLPTILLV